MQSSDPIRKSLEARAGMPLLYIGEIRQLFRNLGYDATPTNVSRMVERRGHPRYEPESGLSVTKFGNKPRMYSYAAAQDVLAYLEEIGKIRLNGHTLETLMSSEYHLSNPSSMPVRPRRSYNEPPEDFTRRH